MNVAFFGTPDFAVPALDAIAQSTHPLSMVVAQPDRRSGRGMNMAAPPVAVRAKELGLTLHQPAGIRSEAFHEVLRESCAEIGLVVAYGRILPGSLLDIPRFGFINIHASLLPSYRGAAPIQRAIESGETKTGVTIMKIDEQLDHGPVLSTLETDIEHDETSPELFERLAMLGGGAIVGALDEIESERAVWVDQDHDRATLAPMIDKSEGQTDFREPASRIYNRWRAFQPWPGISAKIAGETVRLKRLEPVEESSPRSGGRVVALEGDALVVSCEAGLIRVLRAQRAGRGEVSGSELARALGLATGDSLNGTSG